MSTAITETPPEAAPEPVEPVGPAERRPAVVEWLTTVDHQRLGVLFLYAALAFLVLGSVAAGIIRAELTSPGRQVLDAGADGQVFTLHATASVFLFLVPLWLGFATFLVPLQVGASRVAFPRAHALAFWLFLGSGLIVAASYLAQGGPFASLALLVPIGGAGSVGRSSNLWMLGMGGVSAATVLASASLVATVVQLRRPGLTLLQVPPFSWATLVAASVVVLAVPTFVAGLVLLYLDLNHGGRLFAGSGGRLLWQHLLWIYGRPELYVPLLAGAGVVSEIVPTFARRPLRPHPPLLAALGAIGALSFGVWAFDTTATRRALLPVFSPATALVFLPVAAVALMWLATLARGRPRPAAALVLGAGFLLSLVAGGVGTVVAAFVDVRAGSQWASANVHLLLFGGPVFAALAAFHYWAPRIWGRHLSEALGYLTFLLLLVGSLATFLPGYGLMRQPLHTGLYSRQAPDSWAVLNRVSTAGSVVVALALLVFLANLAGSVWRGRGRPADANPWEASTLEWTGGAG